MTGADIAMLAIHVVLDHGRASVLQRQLREIDLLMPAAGGCDHLNRLWSRAHARRSIEYCEDVLVHLKCVLAKEDEEAKEKEMPDRALEEMCDQVMHICSTFGTGYEDDDEYERRRSAMSSVTSLVNIIVQPDNLRPWARGHLDLRGIRNWYRRLEERHRLPPFYGNASADFLELRDLLCARVGRGA